MEHKGIFAQTRSRPSENQLALVLWGLMTNKNLHVYVGARPRSRRRRTGWPETRDRVPFHPGTRIIISLTGKPCTTKIPDNSECNDNSMTGTISKVETSRPHWILGSRSGSQSLFIPGVAMGMNNIQMPP
ncbi:unnamed protein product [Boreogadus saida]